ncbi:acetylxylan esterase [Clostridia bacterium]|nr:acetylxylan esterase [Clostridia bacterium]
MPIVDKPLDELYSYKGLNPKPADFDEYWDRSLAQMHALGTECERSPSSFQTVGVRCEDMYFTGVHGARVYAKLLIPEGKTRCAAVLMFHGYSGSSGDWSDKLAYAANGFVVAALDARGQGGQSQDVGGIHGPTQNGMIIRGLSDPDPERLLMRDVYLDTAQMARIVMSLPEVDPERVGAMGGSQGGGLTLACAALEPRVKRASAQYPFLTDYKRVWDMDLSVAAYAELRNYFRLFDPNHRREQDIFTKLGYIDVQHLAPRIKGEVLMQTGLMDTICPPSTQFAAYNKISASKKVEIWPDFGHEGLPGGSDMTYQFMLGL